MRVRPLLLALLAPLIVACGETTDSIGFGRLEGPATYPNAFRDVLGKTEDEIEDKLRATFETLFYGDPRSYAIYFHTAEDKARIYDTLHEDTRSEGVGLGMMITLQLDKQKEFDRLWRYAKSELRYREGPNRGYFKSFCSTDDPDSWRECADPFGHQQFVMALLFAANRWGRTSGDIDYLDDARAALNIMREKQSEVGASTRGVTNMFDEETKLVFDAPEKASANVTRPSIEMPAYYELWAQATRDPFWTEAAAAARDHWQRAASENGLMPLRADFEGAPIAGFEDFRPEGYRILLNLVLDHVWFEADPRQVELSDRLLQFFSSQETLGTSYALDGTVVDSAQEPALTIVSGVTALASTVKDRRAFIQAAWNVEPRDGNSRYYHGILDLTALLILSGRFRVY